MSRILVVGGYGGFGARLSRRLAAHGHKVLVGGRSLDKAKAFCAGTGGCTPVMLDRTKDSTSVLERERPDLLIDAAGPFQGSGLDLPKACIAAGVHYLDLADAREFVCGIGVLDQAARRAGVAVISGASSVPALSGAVTRHLACGMDQVTAVEIAISASSRASAGASVAAAILGAAGRAFQLWSGGRWLQRAGWQSPRPELFALPSGKSLGRRPVALVDVPDLELLPARVPGRPAVSFRAGTESRIATYGLWAASLLVRTKAVRSLAPGAPWLAPLHRLTALWGSDRSGMLVRFFGTANGRRVERRWTLIAESGHGPEIPTLAAALLVRRVMAGTVEAGARDAGELLALEEFARDFDALAVETATVEVPQSLPLYFRVMGSDFQALRPVVQAMHSVLRDAGAAGRASVVRGRSLAARAVARLMRFPPQGDYPLHVHFREEDGAETWVRDFGGHCFNSRLSESGRGELTEAFGPLRFHFRLPVENGALRMALVRWSVGPLPLPLALAPRAPAREWEEDGRFHFDVPVALPLVGPIVHYRGWLQPLPGPGAPGS